MELERNEMSDESSDSKKDRDRRSDVRDKYQRDGDTDTRQICRCIPVSSKIEKEHEIVEGRVILRRQDPTKATETATETDVEPPSDPKDSCGLNSNMP